MARLILTLACLVALITSNRGEAQERIPGYVNRPTISPYVNLFRANNGGLNSYFSFVRPQLEVQQFMRDSTRRAALDRIAFNREAMMLQQSLELGLNATQQPSSRLQQRPSSNGATMRRPAGRFMNFGTFYPANTGSVTRRR